METILHLFSKMGLGQLFTVVTDITTYSANAQRIYALRESYINTIDPVIRFLQDDDVTLANFIRTQKMLPEASKFEQLDHFEWAFGTMGILITFLAIFINFDRAKMWLSCIAMWPNRLIFGDFNPSDTYLTFKTLMTSDSLSL